MTTIIAVIFPGFELLDLAGPLDVIARASDVRVVTVAKTADPVAPDLAPKVTPDAAFRDAPKADVLLVPGGHGISAAMVDDETIDFIARAGSQAAYVTSVCTGALLLGVAGLLRGYKATTHWRYVELLRLFGAEPAEGRVVEDRDRITGGGVTAGIDFGFRLVARLRGEDAAKRIQLGLEYDPSPPFDSGHPRTADRALVDGYVRDTAVRYAEREALVRGALKR
jgi:cyclohexyl-isocyanide hydratase